MKRLIIPLLAAFGALPAFAPIAALAATPPDPIHDRYIEIVRLLDHPSVYRALSAPITAIRLVDPRTHTYSIEMEACAVTVRVRYISGGGTATEIRYDVGDEICR